MARWSSLGHVVRARSDVPSWAASATTWSTTPMFPCLSVETRNTITTTTTIRVNNRSVPRCSRIVLDLISASSAHVPKNHREKLGQTFLFFDLWIFVVKFLDDILDKKNNRHVSRFLKCFQNMLIYAVCVYLLKAQVFGVNTLVVFCQNKKTINFGIFFSLHFSHVFVRQNQWTNKKILPSYQNNSINRCYSIK